MQRLGLKAMYSAFRMKEEGFMTNSPNGSQGGGKPNMIGVGLALGIGIGTALGSAMGNPAVGVGIGVAVGVGLGIVLSSMGNKK
jgi:hypothetical protein